MEAEALSCNNCGAPLDVSPGMNYVTCAHCRSRLAVHRTPSLYYTEVLEQLDERTGRIAEDLAAVKAETEVERVDREWQIEREKYRESDGYGTSTLPSTWRTVVGVIAGVAVVGFTLFIITFAMDRSSPTGGSFSPAPAVPSGLPGSAGGLSLDGIFVLFGVLVIAMAIIGVVMLVINTTRYSSAETEYKQRRKEAVRRIPRVPRDQNPGS